MSKQLTDILEREIFDPHVRDSPIKAYAIGKGYARGIDPKEVIPTNQDAVEFIKMIDDGMMFHRIGLTTIHEIRQYLRTLGLYD